MFCQWERSRGLFNAVREGRGGHCGGVNNNGGLGSTYGEWVSFIEVLYQFISMDVFGWFPTVVCFCEPFPMD